MSELWQRVKEDKNYPRTRETEKAGDNFDEGRSTAELQKIPLDLCWENKAAGEIDTQNKDQAKDQDGKDNPSLYLKPVSDSKK